MKYTAIKAIAAALCVCLLTALLAGCAYRTGKKIQPTDGKKDDATEDAVATAGKDEVPVVTTGAENTGDPAAPSETAGEDPGGQTVPATGTGNTDAQSGTGVPVTGAPVTEGTAEVAIEKVTTVKLYSGTFRDYEKGYSAEAVGTLGRLKEIYESEEVKTVDYTEPYSEEFFEDHALIFVLKYESSGSKTNEINYIIRNGDRLEVHYTTYVPRTVTGDLSFRRILIDVAKEDTAGATEVILIEDDRIILP